MEGQGPLTCFPFGCWSLPSEAPFIGDYGPTILAGHILLGVQSEGSGPIFPGTHKVADNPTFA